MFLGTQRRFGVEIEFTRANVNRDALARAITDAGVPCASEYYNHQTVSHWKLTTDASCGLEMVSPILQGESGFQDLKTVLDIMVEMGCTVNRSTGVHVHLEAADLTALDVKNIVTRYADNEAEIDSWFPRSRRASNNTYCRSVSQGIDVSFRNVDDGALDAERATSAQGYMRHRFCKVNLNSLSRYNTIEFRQHAGSTDFNKVSNWVLFLQHFVEQSRKIKSGSVSSVHQPWKKKPFAEIREQIAPFGAELKWWGANVRGGRGWKLIRPNGEVEVFSNLELDAFYVDGGNLTGGQRVLNQQGMEFVAQFAGSGADSSLNASIPASVVDFFNQRRDALAA